MLGPIFLNGPFLTLLQVAKPLLSIKVSDASLRAINLKNVILQRQMPIGPLASEVLIDILSDAFFIWTLYPQSSFWVNLNPTQADQVIERNLGLTGVGRILLESDLMLKKTTARLLHPDNPVAGPLSLFFLKDKMFLSLFFT